MSKQMKLLMENFNKFISEAEEGATLDVVLDDVLDDLLEGELMEGILKEMFPTPEDVKDYDEIMGEDMPSKEEIKSGIKQIVKSPEGQKAANEIEQKAGPNASFDDYVKATNSQIQGGMLKNLGGTALSIPSLGLIGAAFGSASQEPHHSHSIWLEDPERVNQAMETAAAIGATGGAVIGTIILAVVLAGYFKKIKKDADSISSRRN